MSLRWAALLWLTTGCDALFRVEDKYVADAASSGDAAIDAPFACPDTYQISFGGSSRYRLLRPMERMWTHSDDCNDDLPGATHLIALDDAAELASVEALIAADQTLPTSTWMGAIQVTSATQVAEGWIHVTGGPLPDLWEEPDQPNDNDGTEDKDEQFAMSSKMRVGLVDAPGIQLNAGLCECDGKPVPNSVAVAINGYRLR